MIIAVYVFDLVTLFFIERHYRSLSKQYVSFSLQFFGTKPLNGHDYDFRQ